MKICPFLNAECIKGQCMAWVKMPVLDENQLPVGPQGYCIQFRSG